MNLLDIKTKSSWFSKPKHLRVFQPTSRYFLLKYLQHVYGISARIYNWGSGDGEERPDNMYDTAGILLSLWPGSKFTKWHIPGMEHPEGFGMGILWGQQSSEAGKVKSLKAQVHIVLPACSHSFTSPFTERKPHSRGYVKNEHDFFKQTGHTIDAFRSVVFQTPNISCFTNFWAFPSRIICDLRKQEPCHLHCKMYHSSRQRTNLSNGRLVNVKHKNMSSGLCQVILLSQT